MVWIGFIPLVCRSLRVSRRKIRDVWYRKQKNSYSLAGSKYKLNTLFKRRNRWNRGTIEEYGKMEGIRDNSMPCGYTPIYGFEAMFGKYLPNDSISSELEKTNCQDELAQKGKWEHKGQLYAKTLLHHTKERLIPISENVFFNTRERPQIEDRSNNFSSHFFLVPSIIL